MMVKKTIWMPADCRQIFKEMCEAFGLHERYVFEDMLAVYCEKLKKSDVALKLSSQPCRQYLMGDDL